ncbi:DUF2642 domain-containing protein [Metabacillus sp. RGM 3146]|uniref:DUF2642 domain-containing protein n=1 Tax=Metabacillus sp. RGM 3146 TaxID=3401092 RepID=UPI003B9B2B49
MNKAFKPFIGEKIEIEVSGGKLLKGLTVDVGSDIIVLNTGNDYMYLPLLHVQNSKINLSDDIIIENQSEIPQLQQQEEELSVRKILNLAKGLFVEIYVTGNQPLHGYILSVMNNYFVFYSPVYKTIYIHLNHLKWLIPYTKDQTPYGLNHKDLPVNPAGLSLARTFDVQLSKLIGELVVLNIGQPQNYIGKIHKIEDNFIEIITARNKHLFINMQHLKTIHYP